MLIVNRNLTFGGEKVTPEDITFLQPGSLWPPLDSTERLKKYDDHLKLFKGRHGEIEGFREAFSLLKRDGDSIIELIVNFPKALSSLYADLLTGEAPRFNSADEDSQEWLDAFVDSHKLQQKIYTGALAQSYRGETILKLRLVDGKAKLSLVPASYWFPILDPNEVTEALGHVIAWTMQVGDKDYLRAEIHFPGSVHQRAYSLKGGIIDSSVDLKDLNIDLEPDQATGVEDVLLAVVPNLELDDSIFGVDDYADVDTLFQQLDLRLAQIAKVLDKHTSPGMYGPDSNMFTDTDGSSYARTDAYITVPPGEQPPAYLTWDAQLEANWKYLEQIYDALFIVTGTNKAAFGLLDGTNALSGAALKKVLMRTLARTSAKRNYWDSALKYIIPLAARLEKANGGSGKDFWLDIEWQDGLPNDPLEDAQVENIRTGGKATSSVKSAIRRLDGGSDESIENEMADIETEESYTTMTQTPFNFLGDDDEQD